MQAALFIYYCFHYPFIIAIIFSKAEQPSEERNHIMKDKLSYSQLYTELETLNTSVYDAILNEDFDGFQNTIDGFISSGIMEQEEFATARAAYRYSAMPVTLDGIWISVDAYNPLDRPITDLSGLPIQELKRKNVQPVYAYLTENIEINPKDNKIAEKQRDALEHYQELYKNLYKDVSPKSYSAVPLVDDISKHQMAYINRVTELAAARSRFYTTFDFTALPLNGIKFIDNEYLNGLNASGKIKYLTESFDNLYDPRKNKNRFTIKDCFAFNGYEKILASNYLQAKSIDRKNWKHYTKGIMPKIPEFYLQLAFYLTIPSSAEIEKFMNLHGYSIKGPMTQFGSIGDGNKTHPVLHRDLCRWIDAGIDYILINKICGFELLEVKEIRKNSKSKATKKQP